MREKATLTSNIATSKIKYFFPDILPTILRAQGCSFEHQKGNFYIWMSMAAYNHILCLSDFCAISPAWSPESLKNPIISQNALLQEHYLNHPQGNLQYVKMFNRFVVMLGWVILVFV